MDTTSSASDEFFEKEMEIWRKYERGRDRAKSKEKSQKALKNARAKYWGSMCQHHKRPDEVEARINDEPVDPRKNDPMTGELRNKKDPVDEYFESIGLGMQMKS